MKPKDKFCVNDRGRKQAKAVEKPRLIMHIDMDAFFAAVEQAHHPELKGKPVIIGGPARERGVVSTCSYEARKYGVHSAMSSAQAIKLCPEGIFVPVDGHKYSHISLDILKILSEFSPQVEPVSIDEAFVDITETATRYGGPKELALEVKRRIREKHQLTASIGISAIRYVAKMASSMSKPDGLTVVGPGQEKEFLWPLAVGCLWGVGPKSAEELNKVGISTIEELAKFPTHLLKRYFGVAGETLHDMAIGIGDDEVIATHVEVEDKSMGHEHTFGKDVADPDKILGMLLFLCEKVSRRLRKSGVGGRTITLKVKHSENKLMTRACTISSPTDCDVGIYRYAKQLLERNNFLARPIRLVGVSVSNLESVYDDQPDLLSDKTNRLKEVDGVIDRLKDRFGEHSISRASCQHIF